MQVLHTTHTPADSSPAIGLLVARKPKIILPPYQIQLFKIKLSILLALPYLRPGSVYLNRSIEN